MTNFADEYPGERLTVHIDHAATVTARMPTTDECARGYPKDVPVLVVVDGIADKVFPYFVALTFDNPHGQPEPDAARDAALYVLDIIGQDLNLVNGRVDELIGAVSRSPCSVAHLADEVREDRAAECAT